MKTCDLGLDSSYWTEVFLSCDESELDQLARRFRQGVFLDKDQSVLPRLMSTLTSQQETLAAPTEYQALAVLANVIIARESDLKQSDVLNALGTVASPVYDWMIRTACRWERFANSTSADIVHDAVEILVRRSKKSTKLATAIRSSTQPYVIRGFLYRYMWEAARKLGLAEQRRPGTTLDDDNQFALDFSPPDTIELERVQRAVLELPPKDRRLVRLHFNEALSYRDIAIILDIGKSTVERRLRKILNTLKAKLC